MENLDIRLILVLRRILRLSADTSLGINFIPEQGLALFVKRGVCSISNQSIKNLEIFKTKKSSLIHKLVKRRLLSVRSYPKYLAVAYRFLTSLK